MEQHELDVWHMRRALELAERGQGRVEPNPMVGCVIAAGAEIIGEGWHRQFGGPHAEVEALAVAGSRARGATMHVTLEPCCHQGKTPPCTRAVIEAGRAPRRRRPARSVPAGRRRRAGRARSGRHRGRSRAAGGRRPAAERPLPETARRPAGRG